MVAVTLFALQNIIWCNHITIDVFYAGRCSLPSVLICSWGDLWVPRDRSIQDQLWRIYSAGLVTLFIPPEHKKKEKDIPISGILQPQSATKENDPMNAQNYRSNSLLNSIIGLKQFCGDYQNKEHLECF